MNAAASLIANLERAVAMIDSERNQRGKIQLGIKLPRLLSRELEEADGHLRFALSSQIPALKITEPEPPAPSVKTRAFFFHYNKPASKAAGAPRLSVHYLGACNIVSAVECRVPVSSRNRKTQPRCVMAGKCRDILFYNSTAIIS